MTFWNRIKHPVIGLLGALALIAIFFLLNGCMDANYEQHQKPCFVFNDTTGFSLSNKLYYDSVSVANGCEKPFPNVGTN